jgi:hypothetical protein
MAEDAMPAWEERIAAVLLSVAGLSTAWASFQAAQWSGEQVSRYSEANAHLTVAAQLDLQAGQIAAFDTILFAAWVAATDAGRPDRARFLETRFSDQFAAAFDTWRQQFAETAPERLPTAGRDQSKMPRPLYAETREAHARRRAASAAFAAGDDANRAGNRFVASTVLLSTVLFLGGISQILKRVRPRLAVLGLASLIGLGALTWLTTLPTAPF